MHIKHIHESIEKLAEYGKKMIEEAILGETQVDIVTAEKVMDMIESLAEAEYYSKISKAMDEAEYGEDYDYKGAYDEHDRRGYRGQPRDSMGRYMSRRRGGRRMGFEEPPYWHMTPDMYHDWDGMTEEERMRDMDRVTHGKMYYTGPVTMTTGSMHNATGGRDSKEGRSGSARRGYMETKEMGKDKQEKMKELENYMKELSSDVTEMISDASPEEKTMLKQKMQVLMSKIQ